MGSLSLWRGEGGDWELDDWGGWLLAFSLMPWLLAWV